MARGGTDRANLIEQVAHRYERDAQFQEAVILNGHNPQWVANQLHEAASMIRKMHTEKLEKLR